MLRSLTRWRSAGDIAVSIAVIAFAGAVGVACSSSTTAEPATSISADAVTSTTDSAMTTVEAETIATIETIAAAPTAPTEATTTTTTLAALECGNLTAGPHTVDIDGVLRAYDLVLPDALGAGGVAAPLMVLFHGFSGSASAIAADTGLDDLAPAGGVVLAVPQAVDSPPTWHYAGDEFGDSAFVDRLLQDLTTSPCIAADDVWLMGFSAGSAFVGVYGCAHASQFAGLAMVSGLAPPICPANDSPSIQITHGVADPLVLYSGGEQAGIQLEPVPESAAGWAARAGCAAEATTEAFGDVHANTVSTWSGCSRGPTVSLLAVDGLGHAWPGAPAPRGQAVDGPVVDPGCVAVRTMTDQPGDPFAACFG